MTLHALNSEPQHPLREALTAFTAHLTSHNLIDPAVVHVSRYSGDVAFQPWHRDTINLANELLAWHTSLTDGRIELTTMRQGPVHLHVTGHLPDGFRVQGYTDAPGTLIATYFDPLNPTGNTTLSPTALHTWAITDTGVIA